MCADTAAPHDDRSPGGCGLQPGCVIELGLAHTYRIDALLAEAGCGAVWRATWLQTRQEAAIKSLKPADRQGPTTVRSAQSQALEREGRHLRSLRHRHLVQALRHGTHQGEPILVLECLHETVGAWLRREEAGEAGRAPRAAALAWARQAAAGLAALHAIGLRHLDLKPSNLLLTPPTALGQWLKLADFGAALSKDEVTHPFFGTPGWLAPEHCRPAGTDNAGRTVYCTDHATDAYALGLLMFRLLTGRLTSYSVRLMEQLRSHGPLDPTNQLAHPDAGALSPEDLALLQASTVPVCMTVPARPVQLEPLSDTTWLADTAPRAGPQALAHRHATEIAEPPPKRSPCQHLNALGQERASAHLLASWVRHLCVPRAIDRPRCDEVVQALALWRTA